MREVLPMLEFDQNQGALDWASDLSEAIDVANAVLALSADTAALLFKRRGAIGHQY